MKLKALHPRKLRHWTIQKGNLGTAHLNRDEKEVDFRPLDYVHGNLQRVDNQVFFFPTVPSEFSKCNELKNISLLFSVVKTEPRWNTNLPYETITEIRVIIGDKEANVDSFYITGIEKGERPDKSSYITDISKALYEGKTIIKIKESKSNKPKVIPVVIIDKVNKEFSSKVCLASQEWKAKEWRWVRRHIQLGRDKAYEQLYKLLRAIYPPSFNLLKEEGVFKDEKGNNSFRDWLIKALDIEV